MPFKWSPKYLSNWSLHLAPSSFNISQPMSTPSPTLISAVHAPRRLQSVDALRGAIMVLMAIDHIRDYVHRGAMQFSPTDLARTTASIFLTRWITHFCAPVFFLTAGIGAYLWMSRGHHSKSELSRFLFTRGLWLIFVELTVLRVVMFSEVHYRGTLVILLILWAIGVSMIALAALCHLPTRVLAAVSVLILALHNTLDKIPATRFGRLAPLWDVLHQQALFTMSGINFVTGYPVLPWIAVLSAGFSLGTIYTWQPARRQRFLLRLGVFLTAAFVLLRALNFYGDPSPWSHQSTPLFTALSFLNVTKYPPSLLFLCMTLGPALIILSRLEQLQFSETNPLIVFGRVPFFYYAAHLALAHLSVIAINFLHYGRASFLWMAPPSMGSDANLFPPNYGYPLWAVYADWLILLAVLYPACLWFSRLKQRRHDWWLSYL
jgi:uncharacterized membrane protein